MEEEIFNLLKEISKNGNIKDIPSTKINPTQRKLDNEKERRFNVLIKHGLVSNNGNGIFIITEYGYDVAKHNSWIEYLNHRKDVADKKSKKEKYDLHISWFQSKTGWLPYLLSLISIGIALWSLLISNKKTEDKEHNQLNNILTQKPIKDTNSSTNNIENEKVVDKDTFHLRNQDQK
ncbi:hypothetical protein [Mesoflavibacter sp. SCSIO 43206]|uniref:hypothetical protein n=1 Tax=Mesoflavibacter sp. SCSIO 43206 TaxID=2779362 RepID=UPI001CAA283B|nr:hypothetical protein [Mesoflavibacter sp. SCSIO 43206]UAB75595.1 hypothetical protein INR78_01000 [Mesoflavibacter sp. SCSIO 43206]